MNKDLYNRLDDEEEMSDQEKRDSYFAEEAENEAYEQWKDNGH